MKIKLYLCIIQNERNINPLKNNIMKAQKFYLVEDFGFMKGNIFCGTEAECEKEKDRLVAIGCDPSNYFISINRFD